VATRQPPSAPRLPRLALTVGEPAGIGPDIALAVAQRDWPVQIVILGDPGLLAERARVLGLSVTIEAWGGPGAAPQAALAGSIQCLSVPLTAPAIAGQLDRANAAHVLAMLDAASAGALRGEFDAVVTGPVHKGVINDAGVAFLGHTEFFAERAGCEVLMLLVAADLRVALATTHLALAAVPGALEAERLSRDLQLLARGLRQRLGIAQPRIAVLGLNPHAGEGGHLGSEEILTIAPVIERLRAQGLDLTGPLSADTAFVPAKRACFDAYLAMFHDQGLPVLKALGFGEAVNVTLGLPYIRTSVDHGTALDLAGSGRADPASLNAAIELAIAMAARRA